MAGNKITNKIGAGKKGPGRPKGSPNKTTAIAKDAIAYAAAGLGGADRLMGWAQEDPKNEHAFWTNIYPKLLPLDVNANHSGSCRVIHVPFPKSALDE